VFGEDVGAVTQAEGELNVTSGQGRRSRSRTPRVVSDGSRVQHSPPKLRIIGPRRRMATRKLKNRSSSSFFDYIWPAMMQIPRDVSMLRIARASCARWSSAPVAATP
jgi:hypothetical protein